jgi:hypothetical protein
MASEWKMLTPNGFMKDIPDFAYFITIDNTTEITKS